MLFMVYINLYLIYYCYIVIAPNPLSLQLSAAPTLVFEGFSLLLTCVTTFSSNVNVNLMVETELNGPSITITREAMVLSTSRYEASFTIPNITSNHTGNYSCFSIASGISISPSSLYKSNNIPINPGKFFFRLCSFKYLLFVS